MNQELSQASDGMISIPLAFRRSEGAITRGEHVNDTQVCMPLGPLRSCVLAEIL